MDFEVLLVLLAVAYLLLPFYLLFSLHALKKRVDELSIGKRKTVPQKTEVPVRYEAPKHTSSSPSAFDDLVEWLKKDWPMKTGALLILLAFGWLTTYAFMNNWIGPVGRISLGIVGGLLILLLGEWRNKKSIPQGSVLVALGGATILVTIFAARTVYDFFTPTLALLFMALVVVFVAFSSVKHRVLSLAVLGLVMGGAAPLLVDSPEPNFLGLFSYLLVLCAGTLWVVGVTGWRALNNVALAIVAVYSGIQIENLGVSEPWTALLFAFAFAVLFFGANSARVYKNKATEMWDHVNILGNGGLLLYWISSSAPEEWKSLVTAGAMLFLFSTAFILFKKTLLKEIIYVYGGVAFVFLAVATWFELDNKTLFFVIYTLEACASIAGVHAILRDPVLTRNLSILLVLPLVKGLESLDDWNWKEGIVHWHSLLVLLLSVASLSLGIYLKKNKESAGIALLLVGMFYAVAWVWLASGALIVNDAMAVMTALTLYTITGLTLNIVGSLNDHLFARNTGAAFIGLVVLRLLAVDVWEMDITGKIITFFVIGSLLIGTAFISKKLSK